MIGLLIAKFASLGVPERFHRLAATLTTAIAVAALCGLLWTCWLRKHDNQVIDDHERGIASAVATTSAEASASASAAVSQTKNEVEKTNDQARKAAAGSDDPLRVGLDRLRAGQAKNHPAPSRTH